MYPQLSSLNCQMRRFEQNSNLSYVFNKTRVDGIHVRRYFDISFHKFREVDVSSHISKQSLGFFNSALAILMIRNFKQPIIACFFRTCRHSLHSLIIRALKHNAEDRNIVIFNLIVKCIHLCNFRILAKNSVFQQNFSFSTRSLEDFHFPARFYPVPWRISISVRLGQLSAKFRNWKTSPMQFFRLQMTILFQKFRETNSWVFN